MDTRCGRSRSPSPTPPCHAAADLLLLPLPPHHKHKPTCVCLCSYQDQTGVSEGARFVLELEFIQCLANPHYLNCARSQLATPAATTLQQAA